MPFTTPIAEKFTTTRLYDWLGSRPWLATQSAFIAQCRATPGNYRPLELIYDNWPQGDTWWQRAIDRYYLNCALARAARVRLQEASHWLQQNLTAKRCTTERVEILSLACGGARDAIAAVENTDWQGSVRYLGIDIDPDAVVYARKRTARAGLGDCFRFEQGNALRPPRSWSGYFDIVTSLGLFDYLSDRTATALLNRIHLLLRPGGALLFGMTVDNPNRRFFEHYLNWRLIYRPPQHILALAAGSRFASAKAVSADSAGFFLVECRKTM